MSTRGTGRARFAGSRRFLGKARASWLYTKQDVEGLFGVCANTVRNWQREGLSSYKGSMRLFLGRDLNDFHRRRLKEAKRPCGPGEVFCVCCKQKHVLREIQFKVETRGRFRTRVLITCPVTGGTSTTYVSETDLTSLTQQLTHNASAASDD